VALARKETEKMKLCTASETISFIRGLEEKAAAFYESLAGRFPAKKDIFLGFANENVKYVKQVRMAYQSVITDAIEGCFAFDLNPDDFAFETDLPPDASLAQAAAKALEVEDAILSCYSKGAEQSGALLADVPRNFKMIVKKKQNRLEVLRSMK